MTDRNELLERVGPGPYAVVGYWEMPSTALATVNPAAYRNAMAAAPVAAGGPGACGLCGTGIVCHFVLRCGDGSRHFLGSDCVEKIDPAAYREARRLQRELRAAERREAAAAARARASRAALVAAAARARSYLAAHPGVLADFVAARDVDDVRRMAENLTRYGHPLADSQRRYLANRADDVRLPVGAVPQSSGRVVVEGRVIHVTERLTPYGLQFKMIVRATVPGSRGFVKLWGTIPAAMFDLLRKETGSPEYRQLVGRAVRFLATVQPSDRDAAFGFVSRPTKPELLPAAGAL